MGKTILIADDSKFFRTMIATELIANNYKVIEAINGTDALAVLESQSVDLVVLDLDMPGTNGFATCEQIRAMEKLNNAALPASAPRSVLPVVFFSSSDQDANREKGLSLGATAFISKADSLGNLLLTVNRILRPKQRLKDVSVLLVDDSKLALQISADTLEQEGVRVLMATSAGEAYEMLKANSDNIDLVVTDQYMSDYNGDELCRKIRSDLGLLDLPIVFISASPHRIDALKFYEAGGTDYLAKPFLKEELCARVLAHVEVRKLNNSLKSQTQKLEQQLAIKDKFLAACSHDLRNPLNGIIGIADLLLGEKLAPGPVREGIEQIKSLGSMLSELISDILSVSKDALLSHDLKIESLEVSTQIESCISTFESMARDKGIHFEFENNVKVGSTIMGNAVAFSRVLNNLFSNAIKFSHPNGVIKVSVEPRTDAALEINIKDSGIGIPKDKIEKIFDPFTEAGRAGTSGEASTGLGLSIAKKLVENQNGEISVESKEGKGTCFKLLFKRGLRSSATADNNTATSTTTNSASTAETVRPLSVLLAEDNEINILVIKKMLESGGHRVRVARNGKIALQKFKEHKFDLILMDMQMPEMDGLEATKEIRKLELEDSKNRQAVLVIGLTGAADSASIAKCTEAGMQSVVTKPIDKDELLSKINEAALIGKLFVEMQQNCG